MPAEKIIGSHRHFWDPGIRDCPWMPPGPKVIRFPGDPQELTGWKFYLEGVTCRA